PGSYPARAGNRRTIYCVNQKGENKIMDENNYGDNYGGNNFYDSSEGGQNGGSGMAIASMVCGILSLICCCGGWLGLLLAAVALVLGIISLKNNYGGREMAIAGIVTGGCGIVLSLVILIFAALASGLSNTFVEDSLQFYNFDFDGLNEIL
ncbi:MAG: DUF4190 domain-containing protein, partial [Lachnospiraceae bacterium]|nr:DUF4190 domain-containing protein [Lachnospiraceae bacterium]